MYCKTAIKICFMNPDFFQFGNDGFSFKSAVLV